MLSKVLLSGFKIFKLTDLSPPVSAQRFFCVARPTEEVPFRDGRALETDGRGRWNAPENLVKKDLQITKKMYK